MLSWLYSYGSLSSQSPQYQRMLMRLFLRGGGVFLWPIPLSQDEATPPTEATTHCCYVESRLTAFPPFMVGVPELFLERCFSSISCSDGSLYIQTVAEVQRRWKGKEEERTKRWTMESRCGDIDKVRKVAGRTIRPSWGG